MDKYGRPTTMEEIEALDKKTLTPTDVANVLRVNPYSINCASKSGTLPWAYQIGSRTIIPKEAFLHYHKYGAVVKRDKSLYSVEQDSSAG